MKIHHQGWNDAVGAFNCAVTLDETRSDYQIFFSGGMISRQQSIFHDVTADWDHNGTPYARTGAYFNCNGESEFFTPLELTSLVLNGDSYIPGLQIEDLQTTLDERIQAASRRAKVLSAIPQEEHSMANGMDFR